MQDINKWCGTGRLTRDAELSYIKSGTALLKFGIAVNARKKSGSEWIDEANYFDCTLWGKRAESLADYLRNGTQVSLECALAQERWEANDGAKRSKVVLNVEQIVLCGGKGESSGRQDQTEFDPSKAPQKMGDQKPPTFEDDIPF
jgi:single-strand DNA-binding protein